MRWAVRDAYRWRRRFALWPRRIGDEWVWLEWFEWRYREAETVEQALAWGVGPFGPPRERRVVERSTWNGGRPPPPSTLPPDHHRV